MSAALMAALFDRFWATLSVQPTRNNLPTDSLLGSKADPRMSYHGLTHTAAMAAHPARLVVRPCYGRWIIRHSKSDYKTGSSYGERAAMPLSEDIYPELETWVNEWRAKLNPQHEYLFTR